MRCPYCNSPDAKVIDSRDAEDGIRRRRECLNPDCAGRFTTYERVQAVALYIIKKDERRQEYSREKLLMGIRKACDKRPLRVGAIEAMVSEIEAQLYQANLPEIPSSLLGELVMERLRDLDDIAYVRFASVYREFTDIEAMRAELEALASGTLPRGGQLPLLDEPELVPSTLRLRPAAPKPRTRTRRPVRPVQTPVPFAGPGDAPREQSKRRRTAR
jgi:transcriptional repressor NrdR